MTTKATALNSEITDNDLTLLRKSANTIRGLTIDAIQKANSGHPGLPLGMADVAVVLWMRHLKHNPADPLWPDRDRFVLSGGHGSMLLYSLLHLTGYDLPMSELQAFRQWGSKTPGHPEYGHTPGVETTTGPLGQGISNAVGMAIAERKLAARFNRPDFGIVDHFTFVMAGDGDMMEGVSHEACSLAGHLKLGKLIMLYDDNHISIDGPTDLSFTEDRLARFAAYGWHVQQVDGHDTREVHAAIIAAEAETTRPSIIACRTIIGFGSPNRAGTSRAHGDPLGAEEAKLTKRNLGWPEDKEFYVPDEVREYMGSTKSRGAEQQAAWQAQFTAYEKVHAQASREFKRVFGKELPQGWDRDLPAFPADQPLATRAASGAFLNAAVPRIPQLIGGSADLTPSNNTLPKGEKAIAPGDFSGRYIHYGVREHAMGAIMNGLALHGGFIPYGGTFLVFSDYMRGSIRLAALMGAKVIFVFTHDSIGLGEDGPTHQAVEHLAALRAMPNLVVLRPADATETVEAWRAALEDIDGPTALALTRQKLPVLDRSDSRFAPAAGVRRGGYVLSDAPQPQMILIGSGSEVHIALAAQAALAQKNVAARVVSMPSTELFDRQPENYRQSVLPDGILARVAVEAAVPLGWHKYTGSFGEVIGLERFGASAPYQRIYQELGITAEAVVAAALRSLQHSQG